MSRDVRNTARWLVLGGYLLTITAANCFHDHGSRHSAGLAAGSGEGLDGGTDGRRVSRGDAACHDGESCVVCQFLSQHMAAVDHSQEPASGDLQQRLPGLTPVHFLSRVPLVGHSRDPPFVV
jgi:hypothetical protein